MFSGPKSPGLVEALIRRSISSGAVSRFPGLKAPASLKRVAADMDALAVDVFSGPKSPGLVEATVVNVGSPVP